MSVRILIIDDNADDRALIRHALNGVAACDEAGSLTEARRFLAGTDEDTEPDAILLDVSLPDGDGERGTSLGAVQEFSRTAPVIVCTGLMLQDCPELSVQAKAAGAANFTSKNLIFCEPANLIRQIDWAINPPLCTNLPAVGTRQIALKQKALDSMARRYDPNDMAAMVATLLERQDTMHSANEAAAAANARVAVENKLVLEKILEQATRTNGRVTALETWKGDQAKAIKAAKWVASISVPILVFLFGPQLKERILLDKEAVVKIVDDHYGTSPTAAKPPKPVAP